jgi:hypothetical protein
MHARITRFDVRVDDIEKLNAYFNDTVIPAYSAVPGYKGAVSFVDRTKGKWQSITYWENEATMRASEQAAKQLREKAARDFSTGDMTVEFCSVETDRREPALEPPPASKQPVRGTQRTRH